MKGFIWHENSCYMDCIIFAFIYREKSNIVKYFNDTTNLMSGILQEYFNIFHNNDDNLNMDIIKFRKLCSQTQSIINGVYPNFDSPIPQDAEEFLQFIFHELPHDSSNDMEIIIEKNLSNANKETFKKSNRRYQVPIYSISPTTQMGLIEHCDPNDILNLHKLLQKGEVEYQNNVEINENNKIFTSIETVRRLINANLLIISIQRLTHTLPAFELTKKLQICIPDPCISLNNHDYLAFAIVAHVGGSSTGHYVLFFKDGDNWYLFDDIMFSNCSKFLLIGSFDELLNFDFNNENNFVLRNGTIFFYEKI